MTQDNADRVTHDKPAVLMEMADLLNSSHDRSEITALAVRTICQLTHAEAGSLLLVDDFTGHLEFEVAMGEQSDILPFFRVPKGQGIAGWVVDNNIPLIVPDVQTDERFYKYVDQVLKFTTREMIAVPLRADGAVIGVLQVINKHEGTFDDADLKLAMEFADRIAAIIHKTNKEKPRTRG